MHEKIEKKPDFWSRLQDTNSQLLKAISQSEGWSDLSKLLFERGQIMRLLADLIQRGHHPVLSPPQVEELKNSQEQLTSALEQIRAQMRQRMLVSDRYRESDS